MAEIGRILIWVALIVVISVAATPSAAASADAAGTSNGRTFFRRGVEKRIWGGGLWVYDLNIRRSLFFRWHVVHNPRAPAPD